LYVIGLFSWLISSWLNFGLLYISRNLSISSRFSSLLAYKCSKYSLMVLWILLVLVVMSPFSYLILLIWVFSLLCFVMLAEGLSILLIFSKSQLFVPLILCIACLVLISFISALIVIISLCLLVLGLVCSHFSRSLR
jgi:hypothetical protein